MEVHDSAALVLGHLAVGDPQLDPVRLFEGRRERSRAIMVRRHSSPAHAFQTTWWAWS